MSRLHTSTNVLEILKTRLVDRQLLALNGFGVFQKITAVESSVRAMGNTTARNIRITVEDGTDFYLSDSDYMQLED